MDTGRFTSREPMMAVLGWGGNPYAYASANPATLVDPTGLWPDWFDDVCRPFATLWTPCEQTKEVTESATDVGEAIDEAISGPIEDWLKELLCDALGPPCVRVGVITLGSLSGEYLQLKVTNDVAKAMKAKRWTADDYNRITSSKPFADKHGNTVWATRNRDGSFDWVVQRSDGVIISARKGESLRSAQLAAEEFKWPAGLVP
jgi:hypothetical protein